MRSWLCLSLLLLLALLAGAPALASGDEEFDRGVKAFEAGNYRLAATSFQEALRWAPQEALYHLWYGMALYKSGSDYRAARSAFESASRLGGTSEVGARARANLEAMGRLGIVPTAERTASQAGGLDPEETPTEQSPTGWKTVGVVRGLEGDDWHVRDTKYCRAWARKGDLAYLEEVVRTLDQAYLVNSDFMGFRAKLPLEFYFFPLAHPAHTQPKFYRELEGRTRFAGLAFGTNVCLVNLGNWRSAAHYEPWEVSQVANHELNHMFLYQAGLARSGDWSWFAEALAEAIEDRVLPRARQQDVQTMKVLLKGYASDETWAQLVSERNDDNLEQYRTYGDILASIVFFLQVKHGSDAIPRLLRAGKGHTLEEAFVATFGRGSADLQKQWKDFYGIR